MEPNRVTPEAGQPSPEQSPSQKPEEYSVPQSNSAERDRSNTERRLGQQIEAAGVVPTLPALPSLPQPVTGSGQDDTTQADASALPVVAADDDLIEKEWVAKAKQIIAGTKDDPHAREQEIKKLQIDYVRKRYGREIGNVSD